MFDAAATAAASAGMPALMAGFLVKTTAVLALALAAAAASKRRPAAFRHFILSAALAGLLILPVLTFAPVGWRSELVPAWMSPRVPGAAGAAAGPTEIAWTPAAGTDAHPVPAPAKLVTGVPLEAGAASAAKTGTLTSKRTHPVTHSSARSRIGQGAGDTLVFIGAAASDSSAASSGLLAVLGPVLALLWAAGLAVLVLRLFVGLAGAVRMTAEGTPLRDPGWRVLLDRFLALFSLRRPVRLRSHPQVVVPMTWGWRRPVVLLPDLADDWSEDERSSALFHELSHIKRADFLVMLLVRASLALFWWNPLCWVVYRELLKEQEIACDELVLRAGIRPSTYAASLLAFRRAAGFRWNPSAALLGMLGRSSFQDRMAAILKQKLTFREVRMKTKIMIALVLVAAVAVIGSARPLAAREAAETAEGLRLAPVDVSAAGPFDVASAWMPEPQTQTQAEKAAQQKKAEEAEKAKQAEKAKKVEKTIVFKPVTVEGRPIEVVITEGGEVRTLKIDKPLTITTQKEGGALILKIDGEEAKVLKGEPLRLEIKGGELEVVKEGVPVRIVEGKALGETEQIATKDGVVYLKHKPESGRTFTLAKVAEGGEVKFIVESHKGGEPAIYWTVKDGEKVRIAEGEAVPEVIVKMHKDIKPGETWVQAVPVDKSHQGEVAVVAEGKPVTMTWTAKPAAGHALVLAHDQEMLEKVRALQEQVQAIKAKKLDLAALEDSLKKLEQELRAKEEKIKEMAVKLDRAPGEYTIVKRIGEDESAGQTHVLVSGKEGHAAIAKAFVSTGEKDDGAITMIFTGHKGAEGKAAAEKATVALKKALPEGYTIAEQKFDEEAGAISFKVKGPEGRKTDESLVKKIVEAVKDALKK